MMAKTHPIPFGSRGCVFFLNMIQKEDQEKLVEEKGKKAQGIWDLDQAGTEKAEHAFSGQP